MIKFKIIISIIYFVFLYIVAWISAREIRGQASFGGITEGQWHALIILWVPILIIFFLKRYARCCNE